MSCLRAFSALLLGSCFAMGCIADAQEPMSFEAEDLEVPLEETGVGIGNGLLPWCFWHHSVQGTLRSLAVAPIATASGDLTSVPSMAGIPPACWKAIQDTVECALAPTMTVTNHEVSPSVNYTGKVGLATGWRTGALGGTERKWVTACLIQRLNAFGVEVQTMQEGNHPSMYSNSADDAAFPKQESTAWADLFSSTLPLNGNGPAFIANVCSEVDLNKACRDRESELDYRICDTAGVLCGLNYVGTCGSAGSGCVPSGAAFPLNQYWTCAGNAQTVRVQLKTLACH